jgi:signal transduction histidine kinase
MHTENLDRQVVEVGTLASMPSFVTKFGVRLRLIALSAAVALMGVVIAVVTFNSQRQAAELRARLSQVYLESQGLGGYFKSELRDINSKIRRFRDTHDPGVWEEFLAGSQELGLWIEAQAPRLTRPAEREVLNQLAPTWREYVRLAEGFHAKVLSAADPEAAQSALSLFYDQSRRLSDLGQDLARAHFESREQLVAHANRTLTQLRITVLVSLVMLFVFGIALAFGVYRHLIAPLRIKLVESQALIERHEKLVSLGMLAAGVAHEIRNPLTAIKAALFLQQKKLAQNSVDASEFGVIEREILRLERIVNNFLQFARPADPKLTTMLAQQPLQEVQGLLARQLADADIELVREESPPMRIRADLEQLKQVLINLVQNAADSIGHHGSIVLRARPDRRSLGNGEDDVVVLEIVDSGKGIPPEVEARLFDPFFTTKDNGTGLGLSIAARIVEKHGGALQYQTRLNHGTVFGVVLPQVAV